MCHVLVIEDEWAIADLICDYLSPRGATSFDVAMTEREAVDLATLRPPDVITSDVRLIEGTGPCAVASIHERLGIVPTIFITSTPAECEPCDHAIAILQKPFARAALTEAFAVARAAHRP
ncbi:response regulator [Sphingomonas radiodurans]|uniref:response regulator n=1 Tax=Sphingomonas radiodurans TaxID=2890321 RepID=UPI001E34AC79|nr:response regulator [Sphingomonas radiodurans]WBH15298.1 response regulator [Sphingomonas radiodurans]